MDKVKLKKIIAFGTIMLVILNLVLFAFQLIDGLVFWIVILGSAVLAYFIIPKIK